MVHRPADSRLLTNLLSHEKDYAKHLLSLLDYSHASLASFSAYASASSPPVSQVILAVASSLAGADDGLRRYAASIDEWREMMKGLKALEDEVGNIMRDREILVTRLIKASKSQKSTRESKRDSLLLGQHQRYPSSSSLSLSQVDSPAGSPGLGPAPSTYAGPGLNTSSKLAAAQSELQACETHLAAKEQELTTRRNAAVREGLGIRCRAMAECGWVWSEMGKEALKTLEMLNGNGSAEGHGLPVHDHLSTSTPLPATFLGSPNTIPLSNKTLASRLLESNTGKPLPEPAASDISSIGPSQSASQVNLVLPPPIAPAPVTNGYADRGGQSPEGAGTGEGSTDGYHTNGGGTGESSGSQQSPAEIRRASYFQLNPQETHTFHVPPAHSISEFTMPVGTPLTPQRHVLFRRITEEDLPRVGNGDDGPTLQERRSWVTQLEVAPSHSGHGDLTPTGAESTSEDESAELQEGKLSVVENPRFAPGGSDRAGSTTPQAVNTTSTNTPQGSPSKPSPAKERGGGFLGSLRGFFGGKTARDKERKRADSEDEEVRAVEEEARRPGALFARAKQKLQADGDVVPAPLKRAGAGGGGSGRWETRTERNLQQLAKRGSDERLVDQKRMNAAADGPLRGARDPLFEPVVMTEDAAVGEGPVKYRGRLGGRARVVSDSGGGGQAATVGGAAGRRLKKPRASRSASVPPPAGADTAKEVIVRPGEDDKDEKAGPSVRRESVAGTGIRRAQEWVGGQREHAASSSSQSAIGAGDRPVSTTHQKGYSSDTGAMTGSSTTIVTTTVVARKKSVTKGKKPGAATSAAHPGTGATVISADGGAKTASTGGKGAGLLSRNSSILGAASAPATMTKHRGANTTGTVADFGRNTQTGLGQGMPTTAVGRRASMSTHTKTAHEHPTPSAASASHKRSSSFDLPASGVRKGKTAAKSATHPQPANTNLMSIVEDVTRGNRQGWSSVTKKPEMEIIKAPPRVGRQDVLDADRRGATPKGPIMEIPKAPGPVVDLLRYGSGGGSEVDVSLNMRRHSIAGNVKEGSASAPDLLRSGLGRTASTSSRPAKSPLRSALRNTSRSPSPVAGAGPSTAQSSQIFYAPPAASAARATVPAPQSGGDPPPPPLSSVLPWEKENARVKGKGNALAEGEDSDDATSISSYETGHEMFESEEEEEETEREDELRASPDRDKTPMPVASAPVFRGSDVSTSTASITPAQPQPRSVPTSQVLLAEPHVGSDVSRSSENTSTPQRRKSVRVSLQPTFSPTPPAIDDDDEEEQMRHAPWVWKGDSSASGSDGRPKPPPKKSNGSAEIDMWEDSSEEDVEYQKARRMLTRAARKEKAV